MTMMKHGNTLATGDEVRRAGTEGKTASQQGKVVGADPEGNQFGIQWGDGTVTWHPPEELERS